MRLRSFSLSASAEAKIKLTRAGRQARCTEPPGPACPRTSLFSDIRLLSLLSCFQTAVTGVVNIRLLCGSIGICSSPRPMYPAPHTFYRAIFITAAQLSIRSLRLRSPDNKGPDIRVLASVFFCSFPTGVWSELPALCRIHMINVEGIMPPPLHAIFVFFTSLDLGGFPPLFMELLCAGPSLPCIYHPAARATVSST